MKRKNGKSDRDTKAENEAEARLVLPKRYYKGHYKGLWGPNGVILPPENVEELIGYVAIISMDYISFTKDKVIISRGNGWRKKHYYFYKEEEVSARNPNQHKYDSLELRDLYQNAIDSYSDQTLKEGIRAFGTSGWKLVLAEYSDFHTKDGMSLEWGYFITHDENPGWRYSFDCNPVHNEGRHIDTEDATAFFVLEEYAVPDITKVYDKRYTLEELMWNLSHFWGLKLNNFGWSKEYDYRRKWLGVDYSFSEHIARVIFERMPEEITYEASVGYIIHTRERRKTSEGLALMERLREHSARIEQECVNAIKAYQVAHTDKIYGEISALTGVDMHKNLAAEGQR